MPDTNFETCPVGTMALLDSLECSGHNEHHKCSACPSCFGPAFKSGDVRHRIDCTLSAILKAHRERMGVDPTCKPSLQVDGSPAAIMATDAIPGYTSETEDLKNSTDPLKIDTFAPLATMRPEIRFETLGVAPKIPNLSFLELEQKQKHRRPWWVRVLLFLRIASVRKTED